MEKLEILSYERSLPFKSHQEIFDKKQDYTFQKFSEISKDYELIEFFLHIKKK